MTVINLGASDLASSANVQSVALPASPENTVINLACEPVVLAIAPILSPVSARGPP